MRWTRWRHLLLSPCGAAIFTFASLPFAVSADVVEVHEGPVVVVGRLWEEPQSHDLIRTS